MATTKSSKIFITESSGWISKLLFHSKVLNLTVYQICRNYDDIHKESAPPPHQGKGLFPYKIYIENPKNIIFYMKPLGKI